MNPNLLISISGKLRFAGSIPVSGKLLTHPNSNSNPNPMPNPREGWLNNLPETWIDPIRVTEVHTSKDTVGFSSGVHFCSLSACFFE